MSNIAAITTCAAVAGVTTHWTFWKRYEFDDAVPKIILASQICLACLTIAFKQSYDLYTSLSYAILLAIVYVTSLLACIAVYRMFLHPTRIYNGPFWSRLSTSWKLKHIAKAGTQYELVDRLHQEYGEIVRWGPNNVSINNVEALHSIYGSQSTCTKPPFYDLSGVNSLQTERDPHRHRLRRNLWDKALGSNASNAFFPRLQQTVDLLVEKLSEQEGRAVSVNDWMHFITFDVMAQFVFSRDWNQLATGKIHECIEFGAAFLKMVPYAGSIPWLAIFLSKIPFLPNPQLPMMEFSAQALDERMKQEPEIPDAMSYILAEKDPEAQKFLSRRDLESDTLMIILAGADTSFSVLVNLCFYLAAVPRYQEKLREEVTPAFKDGEVDWAYLSNAPFLNGLINEILRLHPSVPPGLPRTVPPEGLTIHTTDLDNEAVSRQIQVPGNTIVTVPTYTLHRDKRYWVDPDSFVPERWTTKPEMILNRRAYCPFSIGPYGCAGKYFALMEIKLVTARLVYEFDVNGATEMNEEYIRNFLASQLDYMTLQPPEMKLKFVKRV